MESERYLFPTHKIDKFQTDTECLKDDTKDMIYIQQGIYGLAKDKRRSKLIIIYPIFVYFRSCGVQSYRRTRRSSLEEHEFFKAYSSLRTRRIQEVVLVKFFSRKYLTYSLYIH